jgi:hypothetical protein
MAEPPVPTGLGVPQLDRLRRSIVGESGRRREPLSPEEFAITHAVLDVLGIGLEPVHSFLFRAMPSLEELEQWVVAQVGGALDPGRVALANTIADGNPPGPERVAEIDRVEGAPAVLEPEALESWEEHGYVVVPQAAPAAACEMLARAIWAELGADPDEPDSWYRAPLQQGIMVQLFNAPGIAEIHASPRIHKAFTQLAGTGDLVMSADRCGFNPPVRPGAPYAGPKLHFDLGDIKPPISPGLQGLLYLTDTAPDQGAFRCVPGFHRRLDEWLGSLPRGADPNKADLEALGPEPVPGAAGDLVIWSSALPHSSGPNTASQPRLVHYLRMYPTPRPAARA